MLPSQRSQCVKRFVVLCVVSCAGSRGAAPARGGPDATAHVAASLPVPLPAPFTCGILARAESCEPLWGCVHVTTKLGSCYGATSAILTVHAVEPSLGSAASPPFDPDDGLPADDGLEISSFGVQISSREICGSQPLEAVKCTIDSADACTGEVVATCRVWQDRTDETEVPRIARHTLRAGGS